MRVVANAGRISADFDFFGDFSILGVLGCFDFVSLICFGKNMVQVLNYRCRFPVVQNYV